MPSDYPHGHAYDLFVRYSTRDFEWVRRFLGDLVKDVNRFADPDVYPSLTKIDFNPVTFGTNSS